MAEFGGGWLYGQQACVARFAGIKDRWSNDPNGPCELAEAVKTYGLPFFDWILPLETQAETYGRHAKDKRILRSTRAGLAATLYRMGQLDEARDVLWATTKRELPSQKLEALMRLLGMEPLTKETAQSEIPGYWCGETEERGVPFPSDEERTVMQARLEALGFAPVRRHGRFEEKLGVDSDFLFIRDPATEEQLRRILPAGAFLKPFMIRAELEDPSRPPRPWIWPLPPFAEFEQNLEQRALPFLEDMQDPAQLAERLGRHRDAWDNPTERFYLAMTLHRMGLAEEAAAVLDNAPTDVYRPMLKGQIAALRAFLKGAPN